MTPLEETVFAPLRRTGKEFWLLLLGLLALTGLGVVAYLYQLWDGLGVTGLKRPVYWGVYLANYVFFIGISNAGTLISAMLRLTHAEWRRPITRVAEAITVFALVVGGLQILIDMGRPDRVLNAIFFGRFQSPFLWDFTCIGIYILSSAVYLYLPLIPDLARMRDSLTDVAGWRRWLYRTLALGWQGTHGQHRRLDIAIGVMAVVIIPVAVMMHTVVSWIFGLTTEPMWHSTILGPYFVVGAVFSGIATLFIAMALVRKALHLEQWLGDKQFNYLGLLLLLMSLLWTYFTLAEYLTTYYGALTDEMPVANAKLFGPFNWAFWSMVVLNGIVPVAILSRRSGRSVMGTVIASVAVDIGMWLERFTIVAPSLTQPRLAFSPATYQPTWVEAAMTLGSIGLFSLLFVAFFKFFPSMSLWEVQEGEEIARRSTLARSLPLSALEAAAAPEGNP
jgi:molybdopterin-containing oxidoreductase family membrane subunit